MVGNPARISVLWGALTCVTACGGSASRPASASVVQSDADAGAGGVGAGSTKTCPNGDLPGPDLAAACPTALPEAGSCCARGALSCSYPTDATSHVVARCIDDSTHALFWGQTAVVDHLVCSGSDTVTPLAVAAGSCSDRQAEPCTVHDLVTPQELLNEQFAAIVDGCGGLPDESRLEAEFEAGCATGLSAHLRGAADDSALLSCVEKALGARHFSCAEGVACARVERSTLP